MIGEEEKTELALRFDIAQGWGDAYRNKAYSGVRETGLMDTMIRLTLEWHPFPWLTISPYAAYYEFLFNQDIRDGARLISYSGRRTNESWNFIGGVQCVMNF